MEKYSWGKTRKQWRWTVRGTGKRDPSEKKSSETKDDELSEEYDYDIISDLRRPILDGLRTTLTKYHGEKGKFTTWYYHLKMSLDRHSIESFTMQTRQKYGRHPTMEETVTEFSKFFDNLTVDTVHNQSANYQLADCSLQDFK